MLKISNKQEFIRRKSYTMETSTVTKQFLKAFLLEIPDTKTKQYVHQISIWKSKKNNYTRVRSICLLTGRSRSVYRIFTLSRLKLREYASAGYFIGIKKSQW